jgi:hypothetical protein
VRVFVFKCGSSLIAFLLLLAFPFGHAKCDGPMPRLVFTAEPAKPAFRLGEPVIFKFALRNDDDKDVSVSPAFILNYDLHLNITKEPDEQIPWCGVVAKWARINARLAALHPGQTLAISREISCDKKREMGYSFSGSGKYFVSASYQTPVSSRTSKGKPVLPPVAKGPYRALPSQFTIGMESKNR